jgi:hypothetical protein
MLGRYTTGPLPVGESTSPRLGPPAARVGGRHRFVDGPTARPRREQDQIFVGCIGSAAVRGLVPQETATPASLTFGGTPRAERRGLVSCQPLAP